MSERILIQQAKSGCQASFSQLIKVYQTRLYQYLLARCQNSYDADDVLQDTFISAYKYLHSYNDNWQFNTWLFTIANRLIKKQHKFSYQYDELPTIDTSVELEELSIDENNIWVQIKKVVNSQSYDLLWFFYVEELSIKEIAQILQKSQSWVKIVLYRSKKKLSINSSIIALSKDYLM
ncbi:hypothetical protein MNBD_GAMMA03-1617 [hydrothermal vent metagenome]|uniref:RNA polymerase sigma-70 region 2 domain-containing protein n=1 Tax=hydrothermal vent metagenome TaxID=652676 RepID=A0A3B0VXM6_9ZZZZ